MEKILSVNGLSVNFDTSQGLFKAVDNISFSIEKGECLGIAGESGSGKTQTFFSITGILSDNGNATGIADFNDVDLFNSENSVLQNIYLNENAFNYRFGGKLLILSPQKNDLFWMTLRTSVGRNEGLNHKGYIFTLSLIHI